MAILAGTDDYTPDPAPIDATSVWNTPLPVGRFHARPVVALPYSALTLDSSDADDSGTSDLLVTNMPIDGTAQRVVSTVANTATGAAGSIAQAPPSRKAFCVLFAIALVWWLSRR